MLGKEGMKEESKGESFIVISCCFLLAAFSSFLAFFFLQSDCISRPVGVTQCFSWDLSPLTFPVRSAAHLACT